MMRRLKVSLSLVLAALIIGLLFFAPMRASAAIVWSDNFNDDNFSGWTEIDGTFSATSLHLEGQDLTNAISHPSSVANGKWNYTTTENENHTSNVLFISNGWNGTSYAVSIYGKANSITLEFWIDGGPVEVLDSYTPSDLGGLKEYNISRCEGDTITVRRNGIVILTSTNDTITTSTYFIFNCTAQEYMDDVVVADCEPPETIPTTTDNGDDDCYWWCFFVWWIECDWYQGPFGPILICRYVLLLICVIPIIFILIWRWRWR